jgi:hypothetical protein
MALPPITPTASFVERENDDPQIEGLADDLDIEMPGSRMSRMEYSEGIEVEEEDDGGVVVDFDPEAAKADREEDFYENLAENMDDGDLGMVANDLLGQYDSAKSSREDWEESYSKGLDLLGFKYQERTEPFRGATGVTHPLLAEAATQFQAQAFNEMLPPEGPVRTQVMGELTQGKEAQSRRVKEFMNYYITNVMEEYTPEFDQMLFYLPLAGSTFKKVYYDANLDRAVSKFVPAENLVVPYDAADLETSPFVAQIIRQPWNDVRKQQVNGFYRDVEIHPSQAPTTDAVSQQDEIDGQMPSNIDYDVTLLEFHVDLDLVGYEDMGEDGEPTGIMLPYVVTVSEDTGQVLAIRRNWDEDDPKQHKKQYFVHYKFLPGFGFYGLGLIHTIGGLSRTATAALRQLIDAGTLSNLPAGFKARGLRIRDDDDPLQPGEFRDVDAPGGAIRDSLMPLPFKGPDATLFNLLGFVVQAGQRFATITDMKVGDGNQNAAVGTTVAMLEQGARVMSAVHKRMHYAMRREFKLLARVMSESLPQEYPFSVAGGDQTIMATDFDDRVDVIPVSNPNVFSQAQRIALAQTQMQMAAQAPDMHDMHEAFRRMYDALGVRDIDKILKPKQETEAMPKDPAQENIDALDQVQLQAFQGQNHDAHIMAHLTFGASGIVQQSPAVAVNLQKHVMQHLKLKAEERAMAQMQQMSQGQQLPQDAEVMMQGLVAQFIAEELQNARQLSMQIAGAGEQQGPDPLIGLKEKELQIREQQVQAGIANDQAELQLDQQKAAERAREFDARLAQQEQLAQEKLQASREREIMRLQAQMQQRRQQ